MREEEKTIWGFLSTNLQTQVFLYSRLRQIFESENQILIEHRISELNQIVTQKDILSEELANAHQELNNIILQITSERLKLNVLIDLAPLAYRESLLLSFKELKLLKQKLLTLKLMNQKLIDQSMQYVSFMVQKIVEIQSDQQEIYQRSGSCQMLGESRNYMDVVA